MKFYNLSFRLTFQSQYNLNIIIRHLPMREAGGTFYITENMVIQAGVLLSNFAACK